MHCFFGMMQLVLAMYIDDFIFCGKDTFQRNVISELKRIFNVGTHENGTLEFLGLGVKQSKDGITIDQNLNTSSISSIDIKKGKSLKNDVTSRGEDRSKKLTGLMMWVATQTQPDVSFDVCRMNNTRKSLMGKLLFKANKSLLKLK